MNPSTTFFRGLMLASLGLGLVGAGIDIAFPALLPEPIRQADEEAMKAASLDAIVWLLIVCGFILVAMIVAFVGLFRFRRWSRLANVILTASVFVLWPVLGYIVSSGWAQAFSDAAMVLWGAVLAMAYFSPLSSRFDAA